MQLLDTLRAEFNEHQDTVRALTDTIAENGGQPSDEQASLLRTESEAMEGLLPRIEEATQLAARMHGAAELLSGVPANLDTTLRSTQRVPRAAFDDWGSFARARANGEIDADSRREIETLMHRLEHSRAFVDVTTPDVPGLVPPQWLTDIVRLLYVARPFISAFDQRPLPDVGMTINYPSVTTLPQVGKQATEKTDIPSRKTTVATGVANVGTYGGGEDVSVQVLQRTDPSYLSLMLELYAEQMAITMDTAAIAAARASIPVANKLPLSAADLLGSLVTAAAQVFKANAALDTMVVGTSIWAAFAGAKDSAGRPLFSAGFPSNALGSTQLTSQDGSVAGLTFVVDPNMAPTIAVIGWRAAFTSLLGGLQTLSADNPSKLGRDYAVFEFGTFAARRPDALVELTLGA